MEEPPAPPPEPQSPPPAPGKRTLADRLREMEEKHGGTAEPAPAYDGPEAVTEEEGLANVAAAFPEAEAIHPNA